METALQDLRFALRALRRAPAFRAGGDRHAGHRHCRHYRDLQHGQCRAAEATALPQRRGPLLTSHGSSPTAASRPATSRRSKSSG